MSSMHPKATDTSLRTACREGPQAEFDQFHQGLNAVQSTAAAMK